MPTVGDPTRALTDEMRAGSATDPLSHRAAINLLWCDCCTLTGETPPAPFVIATPDCRFRLRVEGDGMEP